MSFWSKILSPLKNKAEEKEVEIEETEPTEFQMVEEMIRNLQKRERRQAQAFERMLVELGSKMDKMQELLISGPQYEGFMSFAENFAIYYLRNHEKDQTLCQLWLKLETLLHELNVQLILDLHQPFDDVRHQACDVQVNISFPENTVIEVVRPGLIVGQKMVRPAVVVTSKVSPQDEYLSVIRDT
ncbi:nucleotide exchange factor GrpE [Desulfonatronovibrio magnus]|uniref:nucleotide exchange factor GrpE n=1 Tax=Desulfonatronovibrio magnus TaxID=698827 RepID=UPI000697BB7F|nr:nucleotide exchange factor GrpE [Desulfonatronovibrio magnus]